MILKRIWVVIFVIYYKTTKKKPRGFETIMIYMRQSLFLVENSSNITGIFALITVSQRIRIQAFHIMLNFFILGQKSCQGMMLGIVLPYLYTIFRYLDRAPGKRPDISLVTSHRSLVKLIRSFHYKVLSQQKVPLFLQTGWIKSQIVEITRPFISILSVELCS